MHLVIWVQALRIDVIDSRDEAVGHVSPDNIDGILERAEEQYAEYLGGYTRRGLQKCDYEGVERICKVVIVVDEVFHHAKALPDIVFDLKVHEDRADKADAENRNIHRQADRKVLLRRHHNGRDDQK